MPKSPTVFSTSTLSSKHAEVNMHLQVLLGMSVIKLEPTSIRLNQCFNRHSTDPMMLSTRLLRLHQILQSDDAPNDVPADLCAAINSAVTEGIDRLPRLERTQFRLAEHALTHYQPGKKSLNEGSQRQANALAQFAVTYFERNEDKDDGKTLDLILLKQAFERSELGYPITILSEPPRSEGAPVFKTM